MNKVSIILATAGAAFAYAAVAAEGPRSPSVDNSGNAALIGSAIANEGSDSTVTTDNSASSDVSKSASVTKDSDATVDNTATSNNNSASADRRQRCDHRARFRQRQPEPPIRQLDRLRQPR